TGCVAALQPSVDFDIQYIGKIKTAMFGGEGLFLAKLTGPGKVWLQTLPFSRLANRILAAAPKAGGRQIGEGSLLGGLLDGDND
ncbi:MAG: AIM24 family protein, partial [Hydrogenophilaceae bacterium]